MTEPRTELDPRFSGPVAAPSSWEDAQRSIDSAELFWIVTVRADGRPHLSPLVAVWLEGALHFSTGPTEHKAINLRGNSHVILMTGCNDWQSGLDVVLEGDAIQVTDDRLLQRLAEAWSKKWDGRWRFDVRNGSFHQAEGETLVFSVTPHKVLAFGKGSFSHTRHKF